MSDNRPWVQEQRTYIVYCWACQQSIPVTICVDVDNEGRPVFGYGLSVQLKKSLPPDWKFVEVRVSANWGVEEWHRKFLCKSCWTKEPLSDY